MRFNLGSLRNRYRILVELCSMIINVSLFYYNKKLGSILSNRTSI